MRVSGRKVSPALETEISRMFYQLIADLKNPAEVEKVLKALIRDTEITTIIKRLGIAYWLSKGRTIENIKENLAVAPATIEIIKHRLPKSEGLSLALRKVTADVWANKWSEKIKKVIR